MLSKSSGSFTGFLIFRLAMSSDACSRFGTPLSLWKELADGRNIVDRAVTNGELNDDVVGADVSAKPLVRRQLAKKRFSLNILSRSRQHGLKSLSCHPD